MIKRGFLVNRNPWRVSDEAEARDGERQASRSAYSGGSRRRYSAEEKIRIVLEGLHGEESIAELCRKEGINQNFYHCGAKEFLAETEQIVLRSELCAVIEPHYPKSGRRCRC